MPTGRSSGGSRGRPTRCCRLRCTGQAPQGIGADKADHALGADGGESEGSGRLGAAVDRAFERSNTRMITDGQADSQVDSHHPQAGRHSPALEGTIFTGRSH
jgi:hypothetical protein